MGYSVEPAVSGPLSDANATTGQLTALTLGAGASSVLQTFAASKLGRYVVGLTADDGCSSSSTNLTIELRCLLSPGGLVLPPLLVVPSQRDPVRPFPLTALNSFLFDPEGDAVSISWFFLPVRAC